MKKNPRIIRFTVPGVPVPKGRTRFTCAGRPYTPDKTRVWELIIGAYAQEHKPKELWTGPITCDLVFRLPKPKAHPKHRNPRHIKKPDLDNLIKSLKDSLEGIIYKGDQQIFCLSAEKRYSDTPGVNIKLELVDRNIIL